MNVQNEGLISTNSTLILLKKILLHWLFPHFQFGLEVAISIFKIIMACKEVPQRAVPRKWDWSCSKQSNTSMGSAQSSGQRGLPHKGRTG